MLDCCLVLPMKNKDDIHFILGTISFVSQTHVSSTKGTLEKLKSKKENKLNKV